MLLSRLFRPALAAISVLLVASAAFGQQTGERVVLHGDVSQDSYLAGGSVQVRGKVEGDVVAAGGTVEIDSDVSEDVLAAGGTVTLRAAVGDDVRVVGGDVSIAGAVDGDAVAAGGNVVLAPTADVAGHAWLAGGEVSVHGKVGKGLRAAGGHIVVAGNIAGDAELTGRTIEIGPGAVIGGNLRYRSPNEARIDSGAKITGAVVREEMPARSVGERAASGVARVGFSVGLMLAAMALFLLFPVASINAARAINDAPWKALGIGFAVLMATPFAVLLLLVTVVGVWIALALLALYLLLLLAGFLIGVICVGDLGLRRFSTKRKQPSKGWRALSIVATFVVLAIVGFFPLLGGFVCLALLLYGLGGLTLLLARRYATAR